MIALVDPVKDWAWLAVLGAVCEIVGLCIAVYGVGRLKSDAFPNRPLPHVRAGRWVSVRFRRWVLRRKPVNHTIEAQSAISIGGSLSSFVQVEHAKPDTFEPSEQWMEYIDQRLANIRDLDERRVTDANERFAKVEKRATESDAANAQQITTLDDKLTRFVAGENGRGLDLTYWGLLITAGGVGLQAVSAVIAA